MSEKYPPGTRVSNWTIIKEKVSWKGHDPKIVPVIRRVVYLPDKTLQERLESSKYAHLRSNPRALEDFVIRLNKRVPEELRTRHAVEFKHAFINERLLSEYRSFLVASIPTESVARSEFYYLKTHALGYFINKLSLADPADWLKKQSLWTEALLNRIQDPKKTPAVWDDSKDRSPSLIKATIQSLNRFMKWLNKRDPHTYPLIQFEPISKAQFKELKARRIVAGEAMVRKMIRKNDWKKIEESLPDGIIGAGVRLGYLYGLRRSEILGLKPDDVRQGWIHLERQLIKHTGQGAVYGPLKGRDVRKVPHWFSTPKEAYNLIASVKKHLVDPCEFSKIVSAWMDKMDMPHTLHDLRHTWISIAIKTHTANEVMVAAGHKDLNTTNKYLHMGEEYDEDAPYIPET